MRITRLPIPISGVNSVKSIAIIIFGVLLAASTQLSVRSAIAEDSSLPNTEDWPTYEDTKNAFKVTYDPTWKLLKLSNGVRIDSPDRIPVGLSINAYKVESEKFSPTSGDYSTSIKQYASAFLDSIKSKLASDVTVVEQEWTQLEIVQGVQTPAFHSTYRFTSANGDTIGLSEYVVAWDDKLYRIALAGSVPFDNERLASAAQMIASVKLSV